MYFTLSVFFFYLAADGSPLPLTMFQFTTEELALAPGMAAVLVPVHVGAAVLRLSDSSGTSEMVAIEEDSGVSTSVVASVEPQIMSVEGRVGLIA